FSGLKVGVTVATIGAVIGEWVGAQQGLGYLMIQSNARLQTPLVFAAILWLTAMGLGLWILVGLLEKKWVTQRR
ncbi:MAG: ABC transporter permease, partial [Desulfobacterales bacterium]|nr:ABC transporter permease [Desulfobacterales bacterium]